MSFRGGLTYTLFALMAIFLLWPNIVLAKKVYRLGAPLQSPVNTFTKLQEAIKSQLTDDEELQVVHFDLKGLDTPEKRSKIKHEIENKCDLFYTYSRNIQTVFQLAPDTPILFVGLATNSLTIPEKMLDNTTGVYRGTIIDTIKKSMQILPKDMQNRFAVIYSSKSGLKKKIANLKAIFLKFNSELLAEEYKTTAEIALIMRKFKNKNANAVMLFPSSMFTKDLPELIRWQNKLNLPIIGQATKEIEMGLLGGPVMNISRIIPALTGYAVKIFRGRSPSQLPIQYFGPQYALNLKTVSKMGIRIPEEIIRQAKIVGIAKTPQKETSAKHNLISGIYSIAVPESTPTPLLKNVLIELSRRGYSKGKNLQLIFYTTNNNQIQNISKLNQADIIFSCGTSLQPLVNNHSLVKPICYVATQETASLIPQSKHHTYTGVVRASIASIMKTAQKIVPGTKKIAILGRDSSELHNSIERYRKVAHALGLEIIFRSFSKTDEIGQVMQDLKESVDLVLLFPPSLKKEDVPEIVKMQNKLKLPVISQLKRSIQAGLVGGAVLDTENVSKKLAEYIDKLLSGRQPSQLPHYFIAEKYIINLQTVKTLGLKVPTDIIVEAEIVY